MTEASTETDSTSSAPRAIPMATPPNFDPTRTQSPTGHIIWGAILDLRAHGLAISRQRLKELTGLVYHKVDDHVSRWIDEGYLCRVLDGVYEVVDPLPEPRAVSLTALPGGLSKIEVGDFCVDLHPQERRALANMLLGDAVQVSNLQAGRELDGRVSQVHHELRQLKRDLGGA